MEGQNDNIFSPLPGLVYQRKKSLLFRAGTLNIFFNGSFHTMKLAVLSVPRTQMSLKIFKKTLIVFFVPAMNYHL